VNQLYFFKELSRVAPQFLKYICFAVLILVCSGFSFSANAVDKLKYPEDIRIEVFADGLPRARHMAFDDNGVLFLSQRNGKVVALPDNDGDGKADKTITILDNRETPHGLAFVQLDSGYYLYVGEERQVIRMKRTDNGTSYGKPEAIISGIPGGGHSTRTVKIRDGKLYLSVGSSCNVCIESNRIRAAVSVFDLNSKTGKIFAEGLRNTVGMEFSPYSGELWGVNNGRDMLGDDFPKEELNIIREGVHYGWPFCHNNRVKDPRFGNQLDCEKTQPPAHTFTAHMAPLGLAFYQTGSLPKKYNNSLFIAFHGSWNRSVPAGYKIVRVILNEKGDIQSHEDFITGWLRADGGKNGRPVDAEQSPKGDLYISDDYEGVIFRVTKK
jgi:glucose/arabinose dehydrogenase